MNPLIIMAGLFLFVSGILLGRQSQSPDAKIFNLTTPSEKPTVTVTIEPNPTSFPPEISKEPTNTPTKKSEPTISNTSFLDFRYPNSSVVSENNNSIVLTSKDTSEIITSWYENKMKEQGYSSRASAKTNVNGNVMSKLGGGKNGSSVHVEIVKKVTENYTTITITSDTDTGSDVQIKIENNEPYL